MRRIAVALGAPLIGLNFMAVAAAGELSIVGTGDGIELLRALGAAYTADNPETVVIVPPSIGSGGGIAAIGSDKETLARIARPLTDGEKDAGLVESPVFRMPSAFYVHPAVGVAGVTSDELVAIYTGRITNWRDVGGPDMRIKVVRREEADSTLLVLRQTMPGWADLELTERSKTAMTTQESYDTVRDVPGAIGFGPYTAMLEREYGVLEIDGRHPTDPKYPSGVVVAFAFKHGRLTDDAHGFMAFAGSQKARTLLESMGGIPAVPDDP